MESMKYLVKRTVNTIKNFKQNPIGNLGFLIPVAMVIVSFIGAIIGYVLFIVHGGYTNQVSLIKELGISGIPKCFTSGYSGLLVSGVIPKILWGLFAIQMIIMLILYFKNEQKTKGIIMAVNLIIMTVATVMFIVIFITLMSSEEMLMKSHFVFSEIKYKPVLIACMVFIGISLATFIVLICLSRSKWTIGYALLSLMADFVTLPLIMLLLENIIPLALAIPIIGIIFFLLKILFAGGKTGKTITIIDENGSHHYEEKY